MNIETALREVGEVVAGVTPPSKPTEIYRFRDKGDLLYGGHVDDRAFQFVGVTRDALLEPADDPARAEYTAAILIGFSSQGAFESEVRPVREAARIARALERKEQWSPGIQFVEPGIIERLTAESLDPNDSFAAIELTVIINEED
ncbi:MAG: hypothetical protein AAF851_05690 [Myxococcota bacterium]